MNIDIKQEIEKYISENIIKTLSFIALLFGGLIFFIYYLDIRYLPELNLIGSVQLLVFASVTGLLLVFSTIAILILPGLFWQNFIRNSFNQIAEWSGVKIHKIIWFVLPIIFVYASMISYVVMSIINQNINLYTNLAILITINLIWMIILWNKSRKNIPIIVTKQAFYVKYVEFAISSLLSSIISVLPILLLSVVFLQEYRQDIKSFLWGLLAITIIVIFNNWLVIAKPKDTNSIYWYSVLGLISFLTIISLTDQTATFPKAIMRTYKLGNIEASSVILDKQGCIEVNRSMKFHEAICKTDKDVCWEHPTF